MSTLYDQIRNFVFNIESFGDLNKETEISIYIHKTNNDDILKDLDDAYAKGVNLKDYDKKTYVLSGRKEALQRLFNKSDFRVKKETQIVFSKFVDILIKLNLTAKVELPINLEKKTRKKRTNK